MSQTFSADPGQIAPAEAAALVGVVFDVDDTITDGGRLGAEALSALWRLREAGLSLVAVTGRPLGWAEVLARLLPIDVAVGENGAGWSWVEGGRLCEGYWDAEADRARDGARLEALVARVRERLPRVRLASDQRARRCDVAFDVAEAAPLPPEDIAALLELIAQAGARALVSSIHAHAFYGGWDKAQGVVRALREVLRVDVDRQRERWLFVGDSGNDADAFAYFPVSAGVANVGDHLHRLPVPPRYVSRAARGRGFAEIADAVIRRRA